MTQLSWDEKLFPVSTYLGGGEASDKALLPIDRLFCKLTRGMRASDYLDGLTSMGIWLRIGGTILDYEGETGPRRLTTGRNPPRLMIDVVFANSDYESKSHEAFRQFVGDQIEQAFELMLARALKKKAVISETKLRADFAAAMQRFRTEPIPPYVPLGTLQVL
jgi:hypothetical protein